MVCVAGIGKLTQLTQLTQLALFQYVSLADGSYGSYGWLAGVSTRTGGCIFSISRDMAVSIKRCQREGELLFFISIFLHLLRYEFSCASSLGIYHLYFPSSLLPPVQLLRRVLKQSVAMTRRRSAVA